jgi:hypothetical protein
MTSSFKDQTGNTPQSSSEESTEAKAQPSKPSVSSDTTQTSMPIMKQPLKPTKRAAKIDDKLREHAEIARIALNQLEVNGLIRRYRVLSEDRTTVTKVILVFDNTYWTAELALKVLSGSSDNTKD